MNREKVKIGEIFNIERGILQSSKCTSGDFTFITAAEEWKTNDSFSHDCEALVFAAAASGSLGRTHYVDSKFIASDLCFILTLKDKKKYPLDLKFYHFIFNSYKEAIVKATKTGTSKEAINYNNFYNYQLTYFEIDQQKQWVQKLKYIDKKKEDLLRELDHQRTYYQLFRQTILQQAVQGQLTCQSSSADTSEVEDGKALLKHIKAEKVSLIKQGKLKKAKELSGIKENEIPFELPKGWVWCRLGEIFHDIKYGTSQKCEYGVGRHAVLRIPNLSQGVINLNDLKFTNLPESEFLNLRLESGDMLIIRSNGSENLVGRTAVFEGAEFDCAYAGYLMRLRFPKKLLVVEYVHHVLESSYIRDLIEFPLRTTSGVKNINSTEVSNLLIPLPPLVEQRLIVAKVQQLQGHLSELEVQIRQSHQYAKALLQSVLREAFDHKEPNQFQELEFGMAVKE